MTAGTLPRTPTRPGARPRRAMVRRRTMRPVRFVGRAVASAWWALHSGLWRWPKTAAALAASVTATTPVTLRHVSLGVFAYSTLTVLISVDRRARARALSVTTFVKFRQRRRRVRRRWVTVMAACGWVASPLQPGGPKRMPRLVRVTGTRLGVRATVNAAAVALGARDFAAKADRLRAGFGCRDVRAYERGNRVVLDLHWQDPLARTVPARTLPRPSKPLHVVVGVDEHGQPVEKSLALPSLIVGAPGAGKSSEVWTTLAALQRSGIPHRVRVVDPKGGMELGALNGAAWDYVSNPADWPAFLERACGALTVRQEILAKQGHRQCPFTAEHPLDLLVVDELLTVLAVSKAKIKAFGKQMTAADALLVYLSQCRAAGFSVLALAQLAEKETLGAIRGLFSYVTVMRVGATESAIVDALLGTGAHKAYPAHELVPGPATAGIGWVRTPAGIVRYRAAWLPEPERRAVARRMATDTARMREGRS